MRIIIKNLPKSTKKEELELFLSRNDGDIGGVTDVYLLQDGRGQFRRVAFAGYNTEDEAVKSQKYFNNSIFKNHKITVEIANAEEDKNIRQTESLERRILYSRMIFIKKLSPKTDIDILRSELEKFGKITDISIDERGNASVKFKEGKNAVNAWKNTKVLLGMRVKICAYNESPVVKRKEHYNTLFFNFDTVIKRTCEIERIDKRDLVNLKDSALGARIALLETSLVEQTKVFLEHNNIDIDKITDEKSKNILILRNSDILGVLDMVKGDYKLSLAPSKCLALLEFSDEKEASEALSSLNMRRYKTQIIYCEYAPICTKVVEQNVAEKDKEEVSNKKTPKTNKIVVKNVPFQATVSDLKEIFSSFTHVVDIRLPIKSDKTHRGFGFIILDSAESVEAALKYFGTSTHLYGRRLVLEKAKL